MGSQGKDTEASQALMLPPPPGFPESLRQTPWEPGKEGRLWNSKT